MKFFNIIQTIALTIATSSGPVNASPASPPVDECGALGVFKVDVARLPSTVDPKSFRNCLEHPLGKAKSALSKRDCYYGAPYGCHKGYCWKQCGKDQNSGEWCWTAQGDGIGDWFTCKTWPDCNMQQSCGKAAVGGTCKSCGCGC